MLNVSRGYGIGIAEMKVSFPSSGNEKQTVHVHCYCLSPALSTARLQVNVGKLKSVLGALPSAPNSSSGVLVQGR